MPYRFSIDGDTVLFEAYGTFTTEDLHQCIRNVFFHDDYKIDSKHLVDLQKITSFEPDTADLFERARHDKTLENIFGKAKIAIVVNSTKTEHIAVMYKTLIDSDSVEVEVFHDRESAADWLKI